ncbi:unnamed protein product [Toxocara canis]|uniref:CUB domain-containing protein n=1 Tax=Toxocara canis TaxID=6265 RepID=A0A183TW61_TOXCA|nr:unnamed protein product [Toxocara canis]
MGWKISTALLSVIVVTGEAVLSYDPQINYFDGTSYTDTCRSKLERRVSGLSGLLISHQLYGTFPYNASKNCFLLITAPVGYRIRLRVLDFNVLGDPQNCDKDTLHVFDHEKAIDPSTLHEATPEDTSPGPIVGQFCGIIRNASELAISSENALTLWWHSDADLPPNHSGEGFRLLWSAFRKSNTAPCNTQREFTCANQECIPSELACNRYPDCKDESDLLRARQIAHRCDYLDDDPLGSLTGLTLLLICMAVVSCCACMCICACVCCKCMKAPDKGCNTNIAAERTPCCADLNEQPTQPRHQQPQPTPPGFYPPSPPKLPPPSNATAAYSPQRTRINSGLSVSAGMPFPAQQIRYSKQPGIQYPQAMVVANEYGSPTEQANLCTNSDYTYPRNEARHLLI